MSADLKVADVLAVLDEMVLIVGDEFGNDPANRLREARAAVAELMDMARIADKVLSDHGIGFTRGDGLTLRAALSRCGGPS